APAASPLVIAIGGLQGTGKSTLARALAPDLGAAPGALVLRSDEIRKRLHAMAPEARLPPEAYSEAANIATNNTLIEQVRTAAVAGHTTIVDATFLDINIRARLAAAVRETGVPFLGVWLHAPLPLLEQRVGSREGDASDATVAVLRRAADNDPGAGDWMPVDASEGGQALAIVRQAASRAWSRL
ncbi:MAG: AAA family ATPase, partial [Rhodopila sp.]|nr:AAA family ATPase [Rhodopila sp.]